MMRRFVVLLIFGLCFGEINWEIEIVDTTSTWNFPDFHWSAVGLDADNTPHIIYYRNQKLIHAIKNDTSWSTKIIENGFLYGRFSLIIDNQNTKHLAFYRKDIATNVTYVCYGYCNNDNWVIAVIDSIYGFENWWLFSYLGNISLDIDGSGQPGIAYNPWSINDSLHYIKYAYFNGGEWRTSIIEYDTANSRNLRTIYWSPSLKFNNQNIPYIAFCKWKGEFNDTIKVSYFDSILNKWNMLPAIYPIDCGCNPVSLSLSSNDMPSIIFCYDGILAYAYFDDDSCWHVELPGATIGWSSALYDLELDSMDYPHIAFNGDPLTVSPNYCYKDQLGWHIYAPIEDSVHAGCSSLSLDNHISPHLTYSFSPYSGNYAGIKYAKGTFVGIEENDAGNRMCGTGLKMQIYPNISYGALNLEYSLKNEGVVMIEIYDVSGAKRKSTELANCLPGHYQKTLNLADLASGVYFIVLKQKKHRTERKFLLLK
ncbi:MAG: T9SS type A sorting domain-containing protein [candidate division WOR-3 bacterium]